MRRAIVSLTALLLSAGVAQASACFGVSDSAPPYQPLVRKAHFPAGDLGATEVGISFVGHATFRIETPQGVIVATDYAAYAGKGPTPNVVTMNRAHETHYTDSPDPAITHVLRGWGQKGAPAEHDLQFRDMRIRNVSTDLVYGSTRIKDGNSIFIFEVGDLCIGHLGHLHHIPTKEQFARIGFLDIVFAPVDGSYTMNLDDMITTLKTLRARVVVPMHYWGPTSLRPFLAGMKDQFELATHPEFRMKVSKATLPGSATVMVVPAYYPDDDD